MVKSNQREITEISSMFAKLSEEVQDSIILLMRDMVEKNDQIMNAKEVQPMAQYWTCPYCHSNLDPGEQCDCQKEKKIKNIHRNAVFTLLPPTRQIKKVKLRTGGA